MDTLFLLRHAVWLSTVWSLGALFFMLIQTLRRGQPKLYSRPDDRPLRGVIYAFGRGMMPWEKESVARHPLTFATGILYHLGILTAFASLYAHLLSTSLPPLFDWFSLSGAMAGLGLLIKRAVKSKLREISVPDDFVANLLVDLFLLTTFLHGQSLVSNRLWLAMATLLLVYLPLGKIRHCFFFFYTRLRFGLFFGRRGVYPGPKAKADPL